jgi:diguanylate cyclase (GGDEF)-like protein
MTLRTRVLLLGVGLILAANLGLGAVMLAVQRQQVLGEVQLRARTFLDVLGVATVGPMATNRIDALDRQLAALIEQNLDALDIRYVAIVDTDLRVLAHSRQSLYGATLNDAFAKEAAARDLSVVRTVRDDEGETLLVSLPVQTQVPDERGIRWGTIIAGFGLDRLTSALFRTMIGSVASILLVTLVAAALAAAVLDGQIVRPLRRLTQAAAGLADGDLSIRADVIGRDEIARLGDTFNQMADSLERNTRNLEDQVRSRTSELTESNRRLSDVNDRLQHLATTDGLTGLFNFRHFDATLRAELRRSARLAAPLTLLMLDVDHFKDYNDHSGHPAGDDILRRIGEILRARLRATDVPCRYGGEEFAVILLDSGKEAGLEVAEELRRRFEETPFDGEEHQPEGRLTVSIGVATFPMDGGSAEELLRASDRALYAAKQAGRNRVVANDPGVQKEG